MTHAPKGEFIRFRVSAELKQRALEKAQSQPIPVDLSAVMRTLLENWVNELEAEQRGKKGGKPTT